MKIEFTPTIFDSNLAGVEAIAQEASLVKLDPNNHSKEDLELAVEWRKKLVSARGKIEKQGKAARDESNAYSKAVIEYEKKLKSPLQEQELRFKAYEKDIKESAIRKERQKSLPARIAQLEAIGLNTGLISEDFILSKNPTEWEAYVAEQLEEKAQKEQAKKDLKKEIEQEQVAEVEEKKEDTAFADFLDSIEYNEETDIIKGNKVYRLVAEFKD